MMIQGSEEWLKFRKSHITGTDSSVIMNLNPWENEYDLFFRKIGLKEPVKENEAMKKGKLLEPIARKMFEDSYQLKMPDNVLVHPKYKWMACSLDGYCPSTNSILEIKCGGKKLYDDCKNGIIPKYYECQIQHCLEVSQTELAYYCCYFEGEINVIQIKLNREFVSKLIENEQEFYRRIIEFDPPKPKHKVINTLEMNKAVNDYKNALEKKTEAEILMEHAKKEIENIAKNECVECSGLKYTTYIEKGRIDYSLIPELKNVNLNLYRKEPIVKTRITV